MELSTKVLDWAKADTLATKSDCLVTGLFESQILAGTAKTLDVAAKGLVARLIKLGDFEGERGMSPLPHEVAGAGAARVLLVGLGKEVDFTDRAYAKAVRTALRVLASIKAASVTQTPIKHTARDKDTAWTVSTAVTLIREASYRFTERHPEPKSERNKDGTGLRKPVLVVPVADTKTASVAAARGTAITNGMDLTCDLGSLSFNIYMPTYLANTARQIAKDFKLKAEVLGRKQIEVLKMGVLLAVTKGSVELLAFIVLRYEGSPAKQVPVVLVGKGIMFDTGGILLRPGEGMDEMRYDMYGAASVLGTLRATAEMGLKQDVIAVVSTCEDMPSGIATKPGDAVTSMSSQTVEILSTDVEGHLTLCDALTYVERLKPVVVIDVATLTGVCIIVLGHTNIGTYAHSDALADALVAAGEQSFDTAWRMPLDEEYQEQLKSNSVDMDNIGGCLAGSVTAVYLPARFTERYDWAHPDTAGTAWKSGVAEGTMGRPVLLLTRFLTDRG